ncbi:endonuclease domain-containing protein [Micromonospora sp. NPDC048986]|uniref:endonuclease domain-containing protein n=1 Tax=Micromonospora sp. NPDC048986 TaxID=3155644 RepID=UPI0034082641
MTEREWPTGTPWDHGDHNGRHERFSLSCDEYRQLVKWSEGRCGVCQRPHENPIIDHDHQHERGWRAVRGLICHGCNVRLGVAESGRSEFSTEMVRYLAAPFHVLLPIHRPRARRRGRTQPSVGRYGAARCSGCNRLINLDEKVRLRGHLSRIGRERETLGDGPECWKVFPVPNTFVPFAVDDMANAARVAEGK